MTPTKQPPILEYHRERLFIKALPFTRHNLSQCLDFAHPHVDRSSASLITFKKLQHRKRYQHQARVGQIIIRDEWGRLYAKWPDWFHEHFIEVLTGT